MHIEVGRLIGREEQELDARDKQENGQVDGDGVGASRGWLLGVVPVAVLVLVIRLQLLLCRSVVRVTVTGGNRTHIGFWWAVSS